MEASLKILKQYWGYDQFRPVQEEIVDAIINGNDVLALLPTGGGKSICFQVPALFLDGLCIVITPLIALMRDQVEQLNKRGIKASAIYSGMNKRAIDITLDNCIYGNIKFLYVSPERLQTDLFVERVQKMKVNLIAVDEAHCISQWGYDFRPAYLHISGLKKYLPGTNIVALTATATPQVQKDIEDKLGLTNALHFQKSFARKNLSYAVRWVEDKEAKLLEMLQRIPGSVIVYGDTRKSTKEIATFLYKKGFSADFYHAGLEQAQRIQKQDQWITGQTRIMVSTNAFGMGIDKPDVRLVVHLHIPPDIESYYQEAGRAGRDEKKAFSAILCDKNDIEQLKSRTQLQHPSTDMLKRAYQSLANYYQLAVGSGQGRSFDIDIHAFSEQYNFNHLDAYYSLKKLEEEELIEFNESFHSPSQVYIEVDNTELYKFQVANAAMDLKIKALLRIYGGELFNNFMRISESQMAQFLNISTQEVVSALKKLHELKIISYNERKEGPQVAFIQPRQAIDKLPLNIKRLEKRAEIARSKSEAIINYVEEEHVCRTKVLLKYLGELSYEACGVCDNCINNKKQNNKLHHDDYHHIIENLIKENPASVEELLELVSPEDKELFLEVIREMVDARALIYDDQWRLMIN